MKNLLTVFMIISFSSIGAFGQKPAVTKTPDLLSRHPQACGADAGYFASLIPASAKKGGKTTSGITPLGSFPSYAIVNCGKFRLYYEDLITSNPQEGFSDLTLGATRRNTLCDVLTYLQNVFDFSAVPAGNPIRLHVSQSFGTLYPLPV